MRRLALLFSLASVWALTATASANAKVLFGDMNQANYADSNAAGTAQAFQFVANTAGSASDIDVYVNNGSTASTLSVGLYSDANGKPGSLVASGSLKSPKAKAWNDVKLGSSQTIVQGDGYWIALLGTGGKLNYLDTTSGTASSYVDSSTGLSSLPQTFSAGAEYKVSPVSAYVNGTAGTPAMLVGDKLVAPSSDSNGAGFAQAVSYQAATSGTTTDIDLYVNSGTTATKLLLGVYSNNGSQPGSLLTSGSISSPRAGTWNDVTVGAVTLTQGTSYWIALLGTGGQIDYPDTSGQTEASYTDSASGMTSLPATYSSGTEYSASPASAYVNGMTSGSPQQPARADQLRRARGDRTDRPGSDADYEQRHLDRKPDVVRLPVAGLQQLWGELLKYQRSNLEHLRPQVERRWRHDPFGGHHHQQRRVGLGQFRGNDGGHRALLWRGQWRRRRFR